MAVSPERALCCVPGVNAAVSADVPLACGAAAEGVAAGGEVASSRSDTPGSEEGSVGLSGVATADGGGGDIVLVACPHDDGVRPGDG